MEADAPAALPVALTGQDLLPADLDLVLRFDLGALREGLGAEPLALVRERASPRGEQALVAAALEKGAVAWLGLRVVDARAGDRVLVVETGAREAPEIGRFRKVENPGPDLEVYRRAGEVERDGVALVALVGERDVVFASPVEAASVARVMRAGPDEGRGEPAAEGLVSLDWNAARAAKGLGRYPSLAKLMRGVERVRATLRPSGSDVVLEARIRCRGASEADRVGRFLEAIRDVARERPRFAGLFAALELTPSDDTLVVRWTLPPAALFALVREPPELEAPVDEPVPERP
ncbi:MAG: hypothetical protein HY908_06360 [Myxococcales bacterium]|nr:hypothetical protein [Myxococcales bacterium]